MRGDDELLSMSVANDEEGSSMVTVTDGGFVKRTALSEYRGQGRGGSGVLTAKLEERRGSLVGAMVVGPADELFAITSTGVVIRVSVEPVRPTSRTTMGVKLISLASGSTVVAVAHNGEAADPVTEEDQEPMADPAVPSDSGPAEPDAPDTADQPEPSA